MPLNPHPPLPPCTHQPPFSSLPTPNPPTLYSSPQATVKVDYGPRKLVTLQFFYPSQAASRKMDSPMNMGTEV
jgi:hypothetical protein